MKINDLMQGKERKEEDFVKGKYNEAAAFARQDASMDSSISNLTQQASDYEAD